MVNQMKKELINLSAFRECYNLSADFVKSVCKILDITIEGQGKDAFILLDNDDLSRENDALLLYADNERDTTGRLDTTKNKDFIREEYLRSADRASIDRSKYVFTDRKTSQSAITKKPKTSIDIASKEIEADREDFISALTKIISNSIITAQKPILLPQQELQTAMEKDWYLTSDQLGNLLGMSKNTISSKPSGWSRLGFTYTKVKDGAMTLWKISR